MPMPVPSGYAAAAPFNLQEQAGKLLKTALFLRRYVPNAGPVMHAVPDALRRWWHRFDLAYRVGLGLAAIALILIVGALPSLLPARWLCTDPGTCLPAHWNILDHLFVWDAGWYNTAWPPCPACSC